MQNVRESALREEFGAELDRLLHNFLAAAATLVDHARRLINGYDPTSDFGLEYQARKDRAAAEGVMLFVKDLRNYFLHGRVPPLLYSMDVERDDAGDFKETMTVGMSCDGLLATPDEWSKGAKEYFRSAPDLIDLRSVIDEYTNMIRDLYFWFFTQFERLHDQDIGAVNALIERRNQLLMGRDESTQA